MVVLHNSIDAADRLWQILTTLDPPPDIVVEASQAAFLRDLVRHNIGISLLDGFTISDAEMRGLVTRPFQPDLPSYLAVADRGTAYARRRQRIYRCLLQNRHRLGRKPEALNRGIAFNPIHPCNFNIKC